MGHGGTLDPMATGVLILGVGSGTKSLNSFLECTKSYETVVLFGAATDSYDAVGKIVARKEYTHVTKDIVEEALGKFRGEIMQKPSIFSALKVDGKKMYEYAREGKELPVEIKPRAVEVKELKMTEWLQGGKHDFDWPTEEAPQQEKVVVDKVLKLEESGADTSTGAKRKREDENDESTQNALSPKRGKALAEPMMPSALSEKAEPNESLDKDTTTVTPTTTPCPAPACHLRMTVTSGFYVRSLAHDLGEAVGSLGLMSSLVRTRQGDFTLGENVLDYDDLEKGEEVWGPKVEIMLANWQGKEGGLKESNGGQAANGRGKGLGKQVRINEASGDNERHKKRRRNSSSPESES